MNIDRAVMAFAGSVVLLGAILSVTVNVVVRLTPA